MDHQLPIKGVALDGMSMCRFIPTLVHLRCRRGISFDGGSNMISPCSPLVSGDACVSQLRVNSSGRSRDFFQRHMCL